MDKSSLKPTYFTKVFDQLSLPDYQFHVLVAPPNLAQSNQ